MQAIIRADAERSYASYQALLSAELKSDSPPIARELARIGLGVNFYTQWYWKIDLHNLMHFLKLRVDAHAQYEIRQYANTLLTLLKLWTPITHQAFLDYRLNSVSLSSKAIAVIKQRLAGVNIEYETSGLSRREWDELEMIFSQDS